MKEHFDTVKATCRTCDKELGYIITNGETYFECKTCYEAEP